jgi:hypothetical protein
VEIHPIKANHTNTFYFSLFLCHPNYADIRVFGCLCFSNIYVTSLNKLSPRSVPRALFSFSFKHKGYCYLDLLTGHVHVSRHVTFAETIFPFPNVPAPPPRHPEPLLANLVFPFTFLLIMRLLSWQPISLETLLLPTKSRHLLLRPTRPLSP